MHVRRACPNKHVSYNPLPDSRLPCLMHCPAAGRQSLDPESLLTPTLEARQVLQTRWAGCRGHGVVRLRHHLKPPSS